MMYLESVIKVIGMYSSMFCKTTRMAKISAVWFEWVSPGTFIAMLSYWVLESMCW